MKDILRVEIPESFLGSCYQTEATSLLRVGIRPGHRFKDKRRRSKRPKQDSFLSPKSKSSYASLNDYLG